jgi:Tol biopolymer transport system component/DNA-binding winged helix-turn-helix (wHTH) protein
MRFADFEIDLEERQLRRDGSTVPLTPKVYQILVYLIENRDRLCPKEELLASIWPDRVVEEANLTQSISVLRKALDEGANGVKHIGTFPGKGYRFLTDVQIDQTQTVAEVPRPSSPSVAQGPHSAVLKPRAVFVAFAAFAFLAAAYWVATHFPKPKEQSADWKQLALTRLPGAAFEPVVSSDGQHFAFVHEAPGGLREVMVSNKGEATLRTISPLGEEAISPAWSPDATSLAYLRVTTKSIDVVVFDFKSNKARILTSTFPTRYELSGRHLDWSPDGRLLLVDDKTEAGDPFSLYLVSVADGHKTRLTYPAMDIIGDLMPRFAPDGKSVAFVRMIYQNDSDLLLIPATGGEVQKLTSDDALIGDVDWVKNSTGLLFSSARGGVFQFWKTEPAHPTANPTPFHPELTSDIPFQFSLARNAKALVFTAYTPNLDILALDLSSSEKGAPQWTRRVSTWKEESLPQFSPDGRLLAYVSDADGAARVWVASASGANARPVTTFQFRPTYYKWSPDSHRIVYSSARHDGFQIVNIDNPSDIQTSNTRCGHPTYSWDGQSIYCQSGVFLTRVSLNGGPAQPVTDHGGFPVVVTDSESIYYAGGRTDPIIWHLLLAPGSRPEPLITDLLSGYWGAWSVTAKGIYYLAMRGPELWILLRSNTGATRPIAQFPDRLPPIGVSIFSVSEQRQELLVVSSTTPSANLDELIW